MERGLFTGEGGGKWALAWDRPHDASMDFKDLKDNKGYHGQTPLWEGDSEASRELIPAEGR